MTGDELRLYEMIWMRTVASQMNDATGTSAQLRLVADVPSGLAAGQRAEFSASGRVITFAGFLRAYQEGRDEDDPDTDSAEEMVLPALREGDRVDGTDFVPGSHTTQPPARYTEASLVKAMEELGVGRPSTYASVISTILDRGYVWKKGTALVPSFTAFAVVGLLERYFTNLVDYGFTASMEDDLDGIASGSEEALPWLTRFYFGSEAPGAMATNGTEVDTLGLKATVATHLSEIDAREINSIPLGTGSDGEPIVARVGRYGPYLQRGEDRASIPDDLAPDELTIERAEAILAAPSNDRVLGTHPESGLDVQVKAGRFGPYVQVGELTEGGEKPRTASLFASMDPATLTFEQALELLLIPRGRDRPRDQRGRRRAQRALRALPQAGRRHAQPDQRGAVAHGHSRRGQGPLRAAQAAPGPGLGRAVARARDRSHDQSAGRGQGGPLRSVRDRRHHERQPAQGRRGGVDRHGPGLRAPGRSPGRRTFHPQEEVGGQEGAGQEEGDGEEGHGQEERGEEDDGQEGVRRQEAAGRADESPNMKASLSEPF